MIKKVAKDRGLELVLFKESEDAKPANLDELLQRMSRRKVLYNANSIDITDEVLTRLNEAYKGK